MPPRLRQNRLDKMRSRASLSMLWAVAAALCMSYVFGACDYKCNDYSEYRRVPDYGWRYADTLRYTPVHDDSLCMGRLVVGVTHTGAYPYTDLWLEVSYTDGTAPRRDTLRLPMVDRYGSWRGRGIGSMFQLTDTLRRGMHPSGTRVGVRHIMRDDTLRGVNQVGIFFVPD